MLARLSHAIEAVKDRDPVQEVDQCEEHESEAVSNVENVKVIIINIDFIRDGSHEAFEK